MVDEIARDQAEANFAGTYTSTATNSSLTLTTGGNQTGLKVTELISNGVDLFSYFTSTVPNLVWRLQPNQLSYGNQDQKVGFTSYQTSEVPPSNPRDDSIFQCGGWIEVDAITFGE